MKTNTPDFRGGLRGPAGKYLVIMIAAFLVLGYTVPILMKIFGSSDCPWSIKVNGEEISSKVLLQETKQQDYYIQQLRAQYGQLADMFFKSMGFEADPHTLATNILIRNELINQYAEKISIDLPASFISKKLQDKRFVEKYLYDTVPLFLFDEKTENLNADMLERFLSYQGMSVELFDEKVRRGVARRR